MMLFRRSWRHGGSDVASGLDAPSCSAMECGRSSRGSAGQNEDVWCHRSLRTQLEEEVQKLQKQLQEELDLHIVLAKATGNTAMRFLDSSVNVPKKAQELLSSIAALEIAVSELEDELVSLHFHLSQERNERHLYEHHFSQTPSTNSSGPLSFSCSFNEKSSPLELCNCQQLPHLLQPDILNLLHSPSSLSHKTDDASDEGLLAKPVEEISESSPRWPKGQNIHSSLKFDFLDDASKIWARELHYHPNKLSEEMVRCMRNIYICLSESSTLSLKTTPSDCMPYRSSQVCLLSPSLASPSGSSIMPSFSPCLSMELCKHFGIKDAEIGSDIPEVCCEVHQTGIGSYSSAAEVSWMTVGKKQLEYAAKALKKFRVLVEQLAKVDPTHMSCNQRLAFWINLYNALIMHAYLAYGVPGTDIKLFSLMQKASYTVGGHSFSAADIEYILLRTKPPTHRPQLALILTLHTFKISEEHQKYSIEVPEPLSVFALSCGMHSSPAVRIFTADNIYEELQSCMKDYVRAFIGINDRGKLLVPKLLYCFAKGVVEDSLLVDWVCRFLTPEQVSVVRDSASQRKQRLLGARSFTVVPFDSRFRYLFLPDE